MEVRKLMGNASGKTICPSSNRISLGDPYVVCGGAYLVSCEYDYGLPGPTIDRWAQLV
jgi:hypothetical protein